MESVKQKSTLKNGYYYSGYILQTNSVIASGQPMIVAMWDEKNGCFWLWEYDGNRKSKTKIPYLNDLDNEIEAGFYPLKIIIPKDEHLID